MQDFYDSLFSSKESPEDWKRQLTQVEVEDLENFAVSAPGWEEW